jgi:hypothetical protein
MAETFVVRLAAWTIHTESDGSDRPSGSHLIDMGDAWRQVNPFSAQIVSGLCGVLRISREFDLEPGGELCTCCRSRLVELAANGNSVLYEDGRLAFTRAGGVVSFQPPAAHGAGIPGPLSRPSGLSSGDLRRVG